MCGVQINETSLWVKIRSFVSCVSFAFFLSFFFFLCYFKQTFDVRWTSVNGRQFDVRLQPHNNVGVRLILKVCLLSKLDVNVTC